MNSNKKMFIGSAVCFAIFVLFTILVKNVDVMPVGPQFSAVGFASLNKAVADSLPYNEFMYDVSEVLGYLAILTVGIFGLFGIMQLFIKKGFKNVDKDLYILCGLYVCVLASYVIFEKVIINYRPVMIEGELEASYPSSHTMMSVTFMLAAIQQFSMRLKKANTRRLIIAACGVIGIGIIVTRFLSGVHWVTDIIGAVLLSVAWFLMYFGAIRTIYPQKSSDQI